MAPQIESQRLKMTSSIAFEYGFDLKRCTSHISRLGFQSNHFRLKVTQVKCGLEHTVDFHDAG